ncbi:spore coat protein [Jeotgalibacillus soli]|uniref:Spore coat protein GerQ n=1 Tax=Jeotgalibacillus soli TaxID=889306 RepID=A0A0C2R4N1_9BACL|nr:spore coat protein [Jeotgalibacillus soli]KIL45230.1 spore coat protein GerQ [Jeotgalibacillus soli]
MQQNQNQNMQTGNMPQNVKHGGHEVNDVMEMLGTMVSVLDQYTMFRQHIKDQELLGILDRQYNWIQDEYNITVEAYKTGQKPSHSKTSYNMPQGNDTIYGLTPMAPIKPIQAINEINDQGISTHMLNLTKSCATLKAMTALEMTNPIIRRMTADSVANWIEMAFETFLYQNKHHYYQVPQYSQIDMQQLTNSYAPAGNKMMQ